MFCRVPLDEFFVSRTAEQIFSTILFVLFNLLKNVKLKRILFKQTLHYIDKLSLGKMFVKNQSQQIPVSANFNIQTRITFHH